MVAKSFFTESLVTDRACTLLVRQNSSSQLFSFQAPQPPSTYENPPKDSPKSIVPWCLGHKKGSHVMQAYDFNERKYGGPSGT